MKRRISRKPATVRRSVALPQPLVEEAVKLAPEELRHNLNRLVVVSLQQYIAARKAAAFEEAMARMAADPAIQNECGAIAREFAPADLDGLRHD
jgi:hypothetical protein